MTVEGSCSAIEQHFRTRQVRRKVSYALYNIGRYQYKHHTMSCLHYFLCTSERAHADSCSSLAYWLQNLLVRAHMEALTTPLELAWARPTSTAMNTPLEYRYSTPPRHDLTYDACWRAS